MSVVSTLALIFTVLSSVTIVACIILLGWFLIWKAFLSKFRLVRELLGQTNPDGSPATPEKSSDISNGTQSYSKIRKIRKD
ncbi:small integral membrane protein 13 [Stomoxys calcitrans]|uniref:small integral membrane protein 13 n=1 Tax=Stomoxys calcitrans TaxID=35570 RepID=UPI0027E21CF7|nr:small integral membrane protein 13 [Stomoxys calcitrans]